MFLFALLAAGVLTAAPIPTPPTYCPPPKATQTLADNARLLRPQDLRGDEGAQTLASLPPADMELAVARTVAGCPLPLVVREKVQGDGRFGKRR